MEESIQAKQVKPNMIHIQTAICCLPVVVLVRFSKVSTKWGYIPTSVPNVSFATLIL